MSTVYQFPYDSPVRYLPLVYMLPPDLLSRFPTLRRLPRSMGALNASPEWAEVILSDAFLNEAMDAVASLTGIDEENVLMSLYARSVSSAKIVTKINRTTFSHIIKGMDLGSVFHPRYIAADHIVRYVRAMQNSLGSNVETLYKIVGNKAEALEFRATEKSAVCGRPLMELPTRPNLLIGAINREGRIITPGGRDTIEPGDTVVVVTAATGLNDLDDILDKRRVKA